MYVNFNPLKKSLNNTEKKKTHTRWTFDQVAAVYMVIKYNFCCQFVTATSHNHCCKNFAQRGKHITSTVIYHRLSVITDGNKSASSSYFESCLLLVNSPCFHTSMHFKGGSLFYGLAPCLRDLGGGIHMPIVYLHVSLSGGQMLINMYNRIFIDLMLRWMSGLWSCPPDVLQMSRFDVMCK